MLVLRLFPRGKKKHITYKIVVIEKHRAVKGKFIEEVGSYNPHTKELRLTQERLKHWLSKGVLPSPTVKGLIDKASGEAVILVPKRTYKKKSKKEKEKLAAAKKAASEKKTEPAKEAPVQKEKKAENSQKSSPKEAPAKDKK
jgi:small subunit ribosomal protein S16